VQYYFPLNEIDDAQSKFTVLDRKFLYTMQNFRTMRRFFAKFPRLIPALYRIENWANLKRFGFQYVVIARKE
jgi:hypothetical protein